MDDGSVKIRALVVDDEPLARERLMSLLAAESDIEVAGQCANGAEALAAIEEKTPDLAFLDVQMPELDGFGVLAALEGERRPAIIFVTAHDRFALKAFEVHAIDYLLKPVEFSRFLMAVNKLRHPAAAETTIQVTSHAGERSYLFFNVSKKKVKVYLDEILYIESLKEYIRIFTKTKSILTKFQLGQIEELLAKNNFLRVHRSFIVAKDKIEAFSATDIEINGKQIPVGRSYKELVQSVLDSPSGH